MHVWTNGTEHIVATGRGIARIGGDARVHRFPLPGLKRSEEPPPLDFFAVTSTRALFGRNKESFELALNTFDITPLASLEQLRAVATTADGNLIACVGRKGADGKARAALVILDDAGTIIGKPLVLPRAKRISWPGGIWAKGAVPWPDEDSDPDLDNPFEPGELDVEAAKLKSGPPRPGTAWRGHVRLHAGPFGITATSTYSGLVAVFDAATLAPRFAIRVPTQEEAAIHATATAQGVVVSMTIEGREAAVLHVAPDATVIAHKSKFGREHARGIGAHLLLSKDAIVLSNEAHVYQMRLPDLEATKVKGLDEDLNLFAHASASGDRHVVAFGDPNAPSHSWTLMAARVEAPKWAELDMPDFREPRAPEAPAGPDRMRGAPLLAVVARPGTWNGSPGGDVIVQLLVTSTGSAVTGVYVELAGPAIDAALITPTDVAFGELRAPFTQRGSAWRAELPTLPFEAAFARVERKSKTDPPPPPNPSREAMIQLHAAKAGSALLMVRVGPIGAAGTAGSGMQGRSVVIA